MGCASSAPAEPSSVPSAPPPPIGSAEEPLKMGSPVQLPQTGMPSPQQMLMAHVPPGVSGGDWIQVQTAAGLVQLVVPHGLGPGSTFQFQLPSLVPMTVTTTTTEMNQVTHSVPDTVAVPALVPAPASISSPLDDLLAKGVDLIFSLFARVDGDSNGSIDKVELMRALEANEAFKQRLCEAAGISAHGPVSGIAAAIFEKADTSNDGSLQAAELERLLRGWRVEAHETRPDMTSANEQRRLAGAAERAENARLDGGGFAGLTADEALAAGKENEENAARMRARHLGESEPSVWHDGALYATDADAKAARDEREVEIRQQEMDEYLYKERFKGLSADEALQVAKENAEFVARMKARELGESEPSVWHDGALYATDADAKAARDEREVEIRQQEMDEYLYKERFKGLSADEALQVGQNVKLGGEALTIGGEPDAAPGKKMPKGLAARLAKKSAPSTDGLNGKLDA